MTIPLSDYDLDSGLSGLQFREELNPIIESLVTLNASSSLPPITFPYMMRVDQSTTPDQGEIRNPSNNAFLKWFEITDSAVTLFSGGSAVPSLGVEQVFTEPQSIDVSGNAGSLLIGSDQSSGVVARTTFRGHNAVSENIDGVTLEAFISTNTDGSEDFDLDIRAVRGGSSVLLGKLGSVIDFRRAGGGGILDADTVRQAGIALSQIVREAKARLEVQPSFTAGFTPTQTQEGSLFEFNGSSNQTITLRPLAQNTVILFTNNSNGSGNLSFVSDSSPNNVTLKTNRTTLSGVSGESPMCAVVFYGTSGDLVNIVGQNT